MKKIVSFFLMIVTVTTINSQKLSSTFKTNLASQSVDLEIDKTAGKVFFTFQGPENAYFAFGFGGVKMLNTYAIVLNTSTLQFSERKLGDHKAGTELGNKLTLISNNNSNGVKTIKLSRDLIVTGTGAADYFDFSTINDGSNLNIIYSQGSSTTFQFHGSSRLGLTTVKFASVVASVPFDKKPLDLQIYPNPIIDRMTVKYNESQIFISYNVMDIHYNEVLSGKLENVEEIEVNLQSLPAGTYFVKVSNPNGYHMETVLKQ